MHLESEAVAEGGGQSYGPEPLPAGSDAHSRQTVSEWCGGETHRPGVGRAVSVSVKGEQWGFSRQAVKRRPSSLL